MDKDNCEHTFKNEQLLVSINQELDLVTIRNGNWPTVILCMDCFSQAICDSTWLEGRSKEGGDEDHVPGIMLTTTTGASYRLAFNSWGSTYAETCKSRDVIYKILEDDIARIALDGKHLDGNRSWEPLRRLQKIEEGLGEGKVYPLDYKALTGAFEASLKDAAVVEGVIVNYETPSEPTQETVTPKELVVASEDAEVFVGGEGKFLRLPKKGDGVFLAVKDVQWVEVVSIEHKGKQAMCLNVHTYQGANFPLVITDEEQVVAKQAAEVLSFAIMNAVTSKGS